jgi:hypothetical protein
MEQAEWAHRVPEFLELLSDARTLLLMKHHFFGRLAMRMRFEITEQVETAAVRADAVCFFNPHFLEKLDISERAFVIAHELCHLMYGHFDRVSTKVWPLWNAAGDLQINAALARAGLKPPTRPGLEPLYDERFEDWSDEQIYWYLEGKTLEEVYLAIGVKWWCEEGEGMGTPGGDCDFAATDTLRRLYRNGAGDRVMTVRGAHRALGGVHPGPGAALGAHPLPSRLHGSSPGHQLEASLSAFACRPKTRRRQREVPHRPPGARA